MKTFAEWLKGISGEDMPSDDISASWFIERGLPMIVECKCCGMTMALPSAFVSEDNSIYCYMCKGDE